MTRILGIDPGTRTTGAVIYLPEERRVETAANLAAEDLWDWLESGVMRPHLLAIERVQAQGIAGRDIIETAELVGRLWGWADSHDIPVALLYRREVLSALDVSGARRDQVVRARMIEMVGPQGTKKAPGPTFGVTAHSWQALAVAVVAAGRRG